MFHTLKQMWTTNGFIKETSTTKDQMHCRRDDRNSTYLHKYSCMQGVLELSPRLIPLAIFVAFLLCISLLFIDLFFFMKMFIETQVCFKKSFADIFKDFLIICGHHRWARLNLFPLLTLNNMVRASLLNRYTFEQNR